MGSFGRQVTIKEVDPHAECTPEELEIYVNSESYKYINDYLIAQSKFEKEQNLGITNELLARLLLASLSSVAVAFHEELLELRKYKEMYDKMAAPISKEVQKAMDAAEWPMDTGSYIIGGV